jgi:structural maintenance of chromosome 4
MNLSGGEKTLSSLSLIFALHHYKPSPLYVLDEIDAALDFKNVSIIANYIKDQTKNSQFIIISLRNHMFELANLLVGIYKTQDITKCLTYNPEPEKEREKLEKMDKDKSAIKSKKRESIEDKENIELR